MVAYRRGVHARRHACADRHGVSCVHRRPRSAAARRSAAQPGGGRDALTTCVQGRPARSIVTHSCAKSARSRLRRHRFHGPPVHCCRSVSRAEKAGDSAFTSLWSGQAEAWPPSYPLANSPAARRGSARANAVTVPKRSAPARPPRCATRTPATVPHLDILWLVAQPSEDAPQGRRTMTARILATSCSLLHGHRQPPSVGCSPNSSVTSRRHRLGHRERHGKIADVFRVMGRTVPSIERSSPPNSPIARRLVISTGGRMMLDPQTLPA